MKKRIGILGSTGSIGVNSLVVINNLISNGCDCEVVFLSSNNNVTDLEKQVLEFKPKTVYINNGNSFSTASERQGFKNTELLNRDEDLIELVKRDNYDILINSFVGFAGTVPTIEAIKAGKRIALANKETMVVAGKMINELCDEYNSEVIPIDSEHSAILQCLMGEKKENVKRIILTASGGPFRGYTYEQLKSVTVSQALKHPNWNMGSKITIDSATLMNKGLEMIEAKWLFRVEAEKIDVIVHPQSIIHSMVEFYDTSVKAQMGIPDMKVPIQFALTYPERMKSSYESLDFMKTPVLDFGKADTTAFKCLKIAYDVLEHGGTYPAVLNAANEIAVELFLKEKIGFTDIADITEESLNSHNNINDFSLEDLIRIDTETRNKLKEKYKL
ncbi:MAG: 1-deoxy-D-xylulose-5-phosphate reductoisomerase [Ignavibacteriota bacterium]|nr:1-deoxy-D-xylulose-5-phosphate reductoisomerase [Ignavibacteriota bacterium]